MKDENYVLSAVLSQMTDKSEAVSNSAAVQINNGEQVHEDI